MGAEKWYRICELGDSIYIAIENGIYGYSPPKNILTIDSSFY